MKALCTEAALLALRRRYPQIYTSTEKLQIDVSSIHIGSKDFFHGMKNIVPTSNRSTSSPARALSTTVQPLLQAQYQHVLTILNEIFPSVLSQLANLDEGWLVSAFSSFPYLFTKQQNLRPVQFESICR